MWGLEKTGRQRITMLFIALQSWTNLHPHPVFLTGKIRVLQGLAQRIIGPWALWSSIMGLMPCKPSLFTEYLFILRRGFVQSIWIIMGGAP